MKTKKEKAMGTRGLYLHEAMMKLLKEEKRKMTAQEIADALNKNHWYEKTDESPIKPKQILMRVGSHSDLFEAYIKLKPAKVEDEVA